MLLKLLFPFQSHFFSQDIPVFFPHLTVSYSLLLLYFLKPKAQPFSPLGFLDVIQQKKVSKSQSHLGILPWLH